MKTKKGNNTAKKSSSVVNNKAAEKETTAKVVEMEVDDVVEPTNEEVNELENSPIEVKVEIPEHIKALFMKLATGEVLTGDEVEQLNAHTKKLNQAKTKARKAADTEATKKAAEAKYRQEKQAYKIEFNKFMLKALKLTVFELEKGTMQFEDASNFATFMKGLQTDAPQPPRKPGKKRGSGSGNELAPVKKLREGSATAVIAEMLKKTIIGLTEYQVTEKLKKAFPERNDHGISVSVYRALNGKLPVKKVKSEDPKNEPVYLWDVENDWLETSE